MRPTLMLGELIATHMSVPGHVRPVRPEASFIMSGLRAAMAANRVNRDVIVDDISNVLHCKAAELDFLFGDFKMTDGSCDVEVPDYRSAM